MTLRKSASYKRVSCRYGSRSEKLYTFLCNQEIFDTLKEGDFVVVDSREEFRIVRVVEEYTGELSPNTNYKHILKKL